MGIREFVQNWKDGCVEVTKKLLFPVEKILWKKVEKGSTTTFYGLLKLPGAVLDLMRAFIYWNAFDIGSERASATSQNNNNNADVEVIDLTEMTDQVVKKEKIDEDATHYCLGELQWAKGSKGPTKWHLVTSFCV
jgi:hypothetical protein